MSERNKDVMVAIWRAVENHDFDAIRDLYHPDAVYHAAAGEFRGRNSIVEYFRAYLQASPDFRGSVELIVSEGELVAHMARVSGTNHGAFLGMESTGKYLEARGMLMSRVRDGQVIEEWESFDQAEIMKQLGVLTV